MNSTTTTSTTDGDCKKTEEKDYDKNNGNEDERVDPNAIKQIYGHIYSNVMNQGNVRPPPPPPTGPGHPQQFPYGMPIPPPGAPMHPGYIPVVPGNPLPPSFYQQYPPNGQQFVNSQPPPPPPPPSQQQQPQVAESTSDEKSKMITSTM